MYNISMMNEYESAGKINPTEKTVIALVGAAGISFGPVMLYGAVREEGLRGSTLVLVDIDIKRLEHAKAAGDRLNERFGNPLNIVTETDVRRGVEGADFIALSVAAGRWRYWKQDYEIPRKYGAPQDMGENGGPGGLFHSLRSIKLVLEVCRQIEEVNPDAIMLNVTNPLPRVNLAISRATGLNCIGDCPELALGLIRMALYLRIPVSDIDPSAAGLNHLTWYYEIRHAKDGEDLYPALRRSIEKFPFLHGKLGRKWHSETGLYPVSSDSHIGEYLPYTGRGSRSVSDIFPYHRFSDVETNLRGTFMDWYVSGKINPALERWPKSPETGILIIEALATGREQWFGAVNIPNRGYIPDLPDGAIVEVPATARDGKLFPERVPPFPAQLAEAMRNQYEIQSLIADSAINGDPGKAFDALIADPLAPPTRSACMGMFEEMIRLQKDRLPF